MIFLETVFESRPGMIYKREIAEKGDLFFGLEATGNFFVKNKLLTYTEVICVCGKVFHTRLRNLKTGKTQSCGCLRTKLSADKHTTHGLSKHGADGRVSSIYRIYHGMINRCYKPKNIGYPNYGARGIMVCDEWRNSVENFNSWAIMNGYEEGLSIDRIDVNGNYEPSNCRWATSIEQNRNKRTSVYLTAFGQTKTLSEWEKDDICKVSARTLGKRLKNGGWNIEDALTIRLKK